MRQVSVEQAFGWAQQFVAREWRLLVPVALAFIGLPALLFDIALPNAMGTLVQLNAASAPADQGIALAALSLVLIVAMFGHLAIVALALVPGISVREALVRAGRRLPTFVGASLLWCAALMAVMLVAALLLLGAHADPPMVRGLMIVVVLAAGAVSWVRLLALLPSWIVTSRGGPVEGLRAAWRLSRGIFLRLLGAFLLYVVGSLVVLLALSSAGGAIVTLAAQALGAAELGKVLVAILFRTLSALVGMGLQLVAAAFYRQVAPSSRGM